MDYLQDVESTCTTSAKIANSHSSNTSTSKGNNSRKGKGKEKGKSKVGQCCHCDKWNFTKTGDFSDYRSLSGEEKKFNSEKGNESNKYFKYKESSFGLKELTTLIEGAKSKKQKSKVRDRPLLAAEFLPTNRIQAPPITTHPWRISDPKKSWYQETKMSSVTSFLNKITKARGKSSRKFKCCKGKWNMSPLTIMLW